MGKIFSLCKSKRIIQEIDKDEMMVKQMMKDMKKAVEQEIKEEIDKIVDPLIGDQQNQEVSQNIPEKQNNQLIQEAINQKQKMSEQEFAEMQKAINKYNKKYLESEYQKLQSCKAIANE